MPSSARANSMRCSESGPADAMILYTLACEADHRFDSWFSDMQAFDDLAREHRLSCPTCGSQRVGKAIMAPAVLGARKATPAAPEAPRAEATQEVTLLDAREQALRALVREFHAKVMAQTQDVGRRFPEEARRIHEGEEPHRHIRGEATAEEARALLEDGILVMPVPSLPDVMN